MERLKTIPVAIGDSGLVIGGDSPIVIQTMCNTHTCDVEASTRQCLSLAACGAQMIRLTVPGLQDVPCIRQIRANLRAEGIFTPIVADIHFSSATAIAVAPYVDKVRINPGNFHKDHQKAREQFSELLDVCRQHNTAIRIGLNHGSLGDYITNLYGNTPEAMAKAAMEWIKLCLDKDFRKVVVSLKASNTVVMTEAYRKLASLMKEECSIVFPMHLGVTEAGNGDAGRIKSCVGIASLLEEGIGDTIRVSLTEPPEAEIPIARYIAARYDSRVSAPALGEKEGRMLDAACKWGPALLSRRVDEIDDPEIGEYLRDEIMQASRRRFYRPEYIACPGCGRTMYDIQAAFEEVKSKTAHLQNIVIAVMGCIVNGPGEMADADWGYVGEGNGKVTIYRQKTPVLRHIPQEEAADRLLELILQSE